MNDKREFLKAILMGNRIKVTEMKDRLRQHNKPKLRVTAFERNGIIKCNDREFSEAQFSEYAKELRSSFDLWITLFRTRKRVRPNQ